LFCNSAVSPEINLKGGTKRRKANVLIVEKKRGRTCKRKKRGAEWFKK